MRTNGFSVLTPTPDFWPGNFKRPWVLNREITYGSCVYILTFEATGVCVGITSSPLVPLTAHPIGGSCACPAESVLTQLKENGKYMVDVWT